MAKLILDLTPEQAAALALAARGTLEAYGWEIDLVEATRALVRAGRALGLHEQAGKLGAAGFRALAEDRPAQALHCCGRKWAGDRNDPASAAFRHLKSAAHAARGKAVG